MKVSIRASKHQTTEMTVGQICFAANSAAKYLVNGLCGNVIYKGAFSDCEVYRTKTQISAIVYFK